MANLFGTETPVQQNLADGQPYTLGTRFAASVAGQVTGIRWWLPTGAQAGGSQLRFLLYNAAQAIVADRSFASPVTGLGAWAEFLFTTPVTLAVGQQYTAAVFTPNRYVRTDNYVWPKTVGGLTTPAPAGYYDPSGSLAFPAQTFSNVNFFVDPIFEPSPTSAPAVRVWNGSAEVNATVTVWTGSAEVAATLAIN